MLSAFIKEVVRRNVNLAPSRGQMTTTFIRVSEDYWNLSRQLTSRRRSRLLLAPDYEQVVGGLTSQMSLAKVAREKSRDAPGYFRAVVTIRVRATALDIFYNGASGYRAQYFHAAELGTLANRFAIDRLLPAIIPLIAAANKRTCKVEWVEKSFRDSDAKLWPHQGTWLRCAQRADQNLLVERWLARQNDPDKKSRKRAKRSMLTPTNERLLELKGGFLSRTGKSLGTFKPTRSQDIHELGFT
jgi:hypothetical protein